MEIDGLPQEAREAFGQIARTLGQDPDALLTQIIEHVIRVDQDMRKAGLGGLGGSVIKVAPADASALAAEAISGDIRETELMWPSDKPFPWSDAHCAAAVRGYAVRWPLSLKEFDLLRGKWELVEGYAELHQP